MLVGLDLTLFPSYYEPWGYTPLESLAFKVPTLTTSLAGFGLWVRTYFTKKHPGITVLDRNDSNYFEVVDGVAERVHLRRRRYRVRHAGLPSEGDGDRFCKARRMHPQ